MKGSRYTIEAAVATVCEVFSNEIRELAGEILVLTGGMIKAIDFALIECIALYPGKNG